MVLGYDLMGNILLKNTKTNYTFLLDHEDLDNVDELLESFQPEQLLKMNLKDMIKHNGGDMTKTLQELNELMSSLQGTEDDSERKAYFKAKKFYQDLVKNMNEK
jgi:Skp family chaperone for outer membrane proteins